LETYQKDLTGFQNLLGFEKYQINLTGIENLLGHEKIIIEKKAASTFIKMKGSFLIINC